MSRTGIYIVLNDCHGDNNVSPICGAGERTQVHKSYCPDAKGLWDKFPSGILGNVSSPECSDK